MLLVTAGFADAKILGEMVGIKTVADTKGCFPPGTRGEIEGLTDGDRKGDGRVDGGLPSFA